MMLDVTSTLVIAPLRVAQSTWGNEIKKWDHLRHLTISKVLGSEAQRKKALRKDADIYIINRENVAWLVAYLAGTFPFDALVIDELSSFKSAKSKRFKALRMLRPLMKRVIGLTGTPAPNSLLDLWAQMYLLDRGERLGKTITQYKDAYFSAGRRNGHVIYDWDLRQGSEDAIYRRIGDICMSMKAEDYLDLPERVDRVVALDFDTKTRKMYDDFEKSKVLELMEAEEITAVNAAALTNKLLQYSNGAVYDEMGEWQEIHKLKLDALEEIIDTANGQPVLVFYAYKHDLARIQKRLKKMKVKGVKLDTPEDINDWNDGKIPVMLCHPASAGHGLNLQEGGSIIVWFGLTWSLELYQQANARLHRQGQTQNVIIHHLVTNGTMDKDVMAALSRKEQGQELLIQAVKARIDKYKE